MPKQSQKQPANQTQTWNYEATVAQLESIVQEIESGNLELAEVFDKFAWAVEALNDCENFLAEKQSQMIVSIKILEDESDF